MIQNMPKNKLIIKDLRVSANDKQILNGINLEISQGQVHAIMGPNGSGKSTLGNSLMGHPAYQVTKGSAKFNKIELTNLSTEERASLGLFSDRSLPAEIPGVPLAAFLRQAINSVRQANKLPPLPIRDFINKIKHNAQILNLKEEFIKKSINDGLSGGERKKIETLQILMLEPKLIILDELDTGTDVDALKLIGQTINNLTQADKPPAIIIITHYNRIYKYIKPQTIHIIKEGKIVKTGEFDLVNQIEKKGYEKW